MEEQTSGFASILAEFAPMLIFAAVVIVGGLFVGFMVSSQSKIPEAVKKAKKERRELKMYNIFMSTPFLKNYTKKCYRSIRKIAASGEHETRMYTVEAVKKGLLAAFIVGMVGTLLLENPVSICITWVGAYCMLTHMLRMETNRLNKRLLANFAPYVGLLREEYLRTDNIAESFQSAETPNCLQYSTAQIKNILESSDADYELNKFIQETQCSYIRTLAMAAVKINDRGDDAAEEGSGESVFVRALKYIEEDAYSELEKLQKLDAKFSNEGLLGMIGGLPTMCLFPILGTRLIPIVMLSIMTMLQAWYGGLIGQSFNALICILSVVGFSSSSKLMCHDGVPIDDRVGWVNKLLKNNVIKNISHAAAPKKQSKRRMEKMLNDANSRKSVLEMSCERLAMALIAFVVTVGACTAATAYQKSFFLGCTDSFSLMANDDLAAYSRDKILEVDNAYIAMLTEKSNGNRQAKAITLMSDEDTAAYLKSAFPDLGDVQINDQVSRVRKKYDSINGAYFKWWIIVAGIIAGYVGFRFPQSQLKKRLEQVRIEERDDFMQLQTLCTILASADCDVMETLDELSKLTKLYKTKLLTCYLNYATNPEKELARLSSKVKLGNFKHLIKKLELAVDNLSLKEAFEGMDIERKHVLEERKVDNEKSVDAKREKANNWMKFSFIACLINSLLAPILVVGVTSLVDVLGQMQAVM